MSETIGVVDVGGGLRGIYAAGLLDRCLDEDVRFDLGIGVSAGSANLASFATRQPRRNLRFYLVYSMRPEYMSWRNRLRDGSFIDLDYVYSTLSNRGGENALDYPALAANPMELLVVATEAETGRAKYFTKADMAQDRYDIFKASSAIPFVCRPYVIDGTAYYDGALSDPVPIQKAFDAGCDRVVLILTLPEDTVRDNKRDKKLAAGIRRRYPLAAACMARRAERYNESVALAREYAAAGKLLIVAPDDTCGVSTLTRDPEALRRLYVKGYRDGEKIKAFLHQT